MSRCTVKILSKNEYMAHIIVLIANELDFAASISEIADGEINIIDSSFYFNGDCDYSRCIYLLEDGAPIPKGADYIISKPFLHGEMRKVLLELYERLYESSLGHIIFEHGNLLYKNQSVALTEKEALLFEYLYKRAETSVTREELLEKVWRGEASSSANVTDVYVNYIRKKTRAAFGIDVIRSVRGIGYMYTEKYLHLN